MLSKVRDYLLSSRGVAVALAPSKAVGTPALGTAMAVSRDQAEVAEIASTPPAPPAAPGEVAGEIVVTTRAAAVGLAVMEPAGPILIPVDSAIRMEARVARWRGRTVVRVVLEVVGAAGQRTAVEAGATAVAGVGMVGEALGEAAHTLTPP